MLIASWNVAGRVTRLADQAARLLALNADVLCLQELTATTLPRWRRLLDEAGYFVASAPQHPGVRARPLSVLTAARSPLRELTIPGIPWPERVLACTLEDGAEVVNVHSPTSPKPELAKVRTHEAVFAHLAVLAPLRLRVLCGDLNTPRKEHADGTIWTFARDRYGRLRDERGQRWDRAELALIRGLDDYGFRDAYRTLHGYESRELSWEWTRWKGGYRLDHVLLSGAWTVDACRYEHEWRTAGLSDHSAVLATVHRDSGR